MNYDKVDLSYLGLSKFKNTLKNTSMDKSKSPCEYMTQCQLEVIDFDRVKDDYIYINRLPKIANSSDALFIDEKSNELFLIEFKNGIIDNLKNFKLKLKIYDSLLILLDIANMNIRYSRQHINFILVYNEKVTHQSSHYRLKKDEVVQSPALEAIVSRASKLAKLEYIQFDLGIFKGLYFKNVYTYTSFEFQKYFVDIYDV